MKGSGESPRNEVFYYRGTEVYAIRKGAYKAHFITQGEYGGPEKEYHDPPLLFNLLVDPSEKLDIAELHPEVILEIREVLAAHRAGLSEVENQLEK